MIEISPIKETEITEALELIRSLLIELGDEAKDAELVDKFIQNKERLLAQSGHYIFIAKFNRELIGVITLSECFGIYAGGVYGVINEMYVKTPFRNKNTGKMLIDAAKTLAQKNRWMRLDVTAPIEERWQRTIRFYENHGFHFTGEKLRYRFNN